MMFSAVGMLRWIAVLLVITRMANSRLLNNVQSGNRRHSDIMATKKVSTCKVSTLSTLRGGSTPIFSFDNLMNRTKIAKTLDLTGATEVLVTTTFGSTFLDKKKKLTMNRNDSVLALKDQLYARFPGSPPVQLQKLYFSNRMLNDTEILGNISSLTPLPVVLDMISGTSVYNRNMSIAQSLEAYVATVVQQAYIGSKLQETHSADDGNEDLAAMDTPLYRELFHSINATLYEMYAEDIALATEAETEPEAVSADTAAWRATDSSAGVRPLTAAIAKEFDLNLRGLQSFVYYSIILVVFAYFGSPTPASTRTMLAMIPVLWLSKLRQLRLLFKLGLYLALPVIYEMDFLIPLLPAPLQVIAQQSSKWGADMESPKVDVASSWVGRLKRTLLGSTKARNSRFSAASRMLRAKKASTKGETRDVEPTVEVQWSETEDDVIDLDESDAVEEQGREVEAGLEPLADEDNIDVEVQDSEFATPEADEEDDLNNHDDLNFEAEELDDVGDDWLDVDDE